MVAVVPKLVDVVYVCCSQTDGKSQVYTHWYKNNYVNVLFHAISPNEHQQVMVIPPILSRPMKVSCLLFK